MVLRVYAIGYRYGAGVATKHEGNCEKEEDGID